MSTTPRSMSPVKSSSPTKNGTAFNQSMMVELPTHLGDETEPVEDETVKLFSQPQSPTRTQVPKVEQQSQGMGMAMMRNLERQRQAQNQTPEPQNRRSNRSEMQSPGHIAAFDWDNFHDRYQKALQDADEEEKQLLEEFDTLIKYFNVWASASSTHDNERAVKRLQTRERHVRLSEQTLQQKKQHLGEVVRAFQSALALLSATR